MDPAFFAERLQTLALVLMRISGITFVAPPFGGPVVSGVVRGLVALVLTLVVLPVVPVWTGADPWAFTAAAAGELVMGLGIGLMVLLLFLAVQGAGDLLDLELGLGIANVIDPQFEQPVPLLGNFLNILSLLLFLSIDGHLMVLRALLASFEAIPPGGGAWTGSVFGGVVEQFAWVILTAVRISLPVTGVMFLTTVALAVVARTMPQLNVFLIGLPLRIGMGVLLLAVVLPSVAREVLAGVDVVFAAVDGFLRALGREGV